MEKTSLPEACAWSATAQNGDEIILAGGLVGDTPSARVIAYRWHGTNVVNRDLPNLPSPLAGAGAAVLGGSLYVVGGIHSIGSGEASKDVLKLDLLSSNPKWESLPRCPEAARSFRW